MQIFFRPGVTSAAVLLKAKVIMVVSEEMEVNVGKLLKGVKRCSPENQATLGQVKTREQEKAYALEANQAVLKLTQSNSAFYHPQSPPRPC